MTPPPRNRLSPGEMLLGGGSILGTIGTFMPWWTFSVTCSGPYCGSAGFGGLSSYSSSGSSTGTGTLIWAALGFSTLIIILRLGAARNPSSALAWTDSAWRLTLLLTGVAIFGLVFAWLDDARNSSNFGGSGFGLQTSIGFGIYATTAGVLAALVGSLMSAAGGRANPAPPRPPRYAMPGYAGYPPQMLGYPIPGAPPPGYPAPGYPPVSPYGPPPAYPPGFLPPPGFPPVPGTPPLAHGAPPAYTPPGYPPPGYPPPGYPPPGYAPPGYPGYPAPPPDPSQPQSTAPPPPESNPAPW